MSDQLPVSARTFPGLPPVAVNNDALVRFNLEMDRRLAEFDVRFFSPRKHPAIGVRRHRNQPPRRPR
jgi:hypothetical protein